MRILRRHVAAALGSIAFVSLLAASGCSSSSSSGTTTPATGSSCKVATDCYAGVDAGALHGSVTCLTSVTNGYCTHTCQSDADCCAVAGECAAGIKQVCAPFESTGQNYCFVSCASGDIPASAGTTDANVFCQRYAGASFSCRSTGGGRNNQQFCGG